MPYTATFLVSRAQSREAHGVSGDNWLDVSFMANEIYQSTNTQMTWPNATWHALEREFGGFVGWAGGRGWMEGQSVYFSALVDLKCEINGLVQKCRECQVLTCWAWQGDKKPLVAKVVISARGATKHPRVKKVTKLASSINRLFMTSILIDFSEFFIIVYNKVKVLHVSVTVR